MGGVSTDSLAKEFHSLRTQLHVPPGSRLYDLRGSVNSDLNAAGVSHLFQLYVTGHAVDADIMSRYVSVQLVEEMQVYFRHIQRLLDAIKERAAEVGIV